MDFSYKEKSLIASLGVTLLIFGWYFYGVFSTLSLEPDPPSIVTIVLLIIWVVVLESCIQGVLASRKQGELEGELEDERDKYIEKVSHKYSYHFLTACLWFLMVQSLLDTRFDASLMLTTSHGLFHSLLLCFVLSEIIRFGTQLYHYRRGF